MLKTLAGPVTLMFAVSIAAQTQTLSATYLSNDDIQAFLKALPPDKISDSSMRVVDVGGYHVAVYAVFRPKGLPQDANLHQTKVSEIYYILEGAGTLVTGGTLPNPKPLTPGDRINLTSPRVDGGVSRRVSKGDVIIIPGHTPHWWSSQDGDLKYLIFRPDPESTIPLK